MAKGGYRGASTLVGWNANSFVPSAGRKSHVSSNVKVARTREEAAAINKLARAKLANPGKGKLKAPPATAPRLAPLSAPPKTPAEINEQRKRLAANRRISGPAKVIVEKRRLSPRKPKTPA